MAKVKLASVFANDFIFTIYAEPVPEIWSSKLLTKFFKSHGQKVPDFLKVKVDTDTLKEILKEFEGGQS